MPKILIVEDEPIVAAGMVAALDAAGHIVCGPARDGPQAVRLGLCELPDLALVDITLADGTDGISTANELSTRSGTPILFVTGQRHLVERNPIGLGCLDKPVDGGDIIAAIDIALDVAAGLPAPRELPPGLVLWGTGAEPPAVLVPAEGEARFRAVFEDAPHGIAIVNLQGVVVDANRALARVVGVAAEALVGFAADTLPCFDRTLAAALEDALAGRHPVVEPVEVEARCLDGCTRCMLVHGRLVRGRHREPRFCVLHIQDVSEQREAEAALRRLALTDPLTQLPNRTGFRQRLEAAQARHVRGQAVAALLLVDLDDFKSINDTYGHQGGDCVLQAVAQRIAGRLRHVDCAARIGGDEFAVVLETKSLEGALKVAHDIAHLICKPIAMPDGEGSISACIGVAACGAMDTGIDEVIRRADAALYRAKAIGAGAVRLAPEPTADLGAWQDEMVCADTQSERLAGSRPTS